MTVRHPSLESLRIFESCARLGSHALAARELGLSPSVVGSRIRALEADLGAPLVEQARPKIKLTAQGRKFAHDIGQALDAIRQAVERIDAKGERRLKVNVTPALASRWLAPRLSRWETWPNAIPVELDVGLPLPAIGKGHCDLAIRVGRGHWPGLSAELLMPVRLTPMMSPSLFKSLGSPRAPGDLADAPLLPAELWPRWFRETGVDLRAEVGGPPFPSPESLAERALAGEGVALLSPILFRSLLAAKRLVAPFVQVLDGPDGYYLVHKPAHRNDQVGTFFHWLKSETGVER